MKRGPRDKKIKGWYTHEVYMLSIHGNGVALSFDKKKNHFSYNRTIASPS